MLPCSPRESGGGIPDNGAAVIFIVIHNSNIQTSRTGIDTKTHDAIVVSELVFCFQAIAANGKNDHILNDNNTNSSRLSGIPPSLQHRKIS